MHPNKFLKRDSVAAEPMMSAAEKAEKLAALANAVSAMRDEAITARKQSGIEDVWATCEDSYLGIDDANRQEFAGAKWAKPTSIAGPVTTSATSRDNTKSSVFVRLSSRYADNAAAKLCEILLPIDDKAFSLEASPIADLIKTQKDLTPLIDQATGQPVMRPATPEDAPQPPAAMPPMPPQAGMPPGAPPMPGAPPPMVPKTVADKAKEDQARAAESAEKAEKRIYDWMIESKYHAETRKVVKDAARLGVGVLKGPYPSAKSSKAMVKVKGGLAMEIKREIKPVTTWVDPWNFFPADGCGEDIHEGDDTHERDFMSKKKLAELKKQPGYIKDQIDAAIEEGPDKKYSEGAGPGDKKANTNRYTVWHSYCTIKREDMIAADAINIEDLDANHDEVFAIITTVNDRVIRATINPLDSGAFPYHVMAWSRRPGHWAGVGPIEQISMPQRMVNAATRSLLNNAGLTSGVQIVLDQAAVKPADGKYVLTPNKIWFMTEDSGGKSARDAFIAIVIPSVQREMSAIIEYAMKLAEESSGIPLITQGQTGPTTPDTFGAAELQDNNAHTWLRSIGYAFDDMITEPVVNDYYEWLLLDPSIPDEEKGDFTINAHGSIAMVERAIQEQTLAQLLGASANPAFAVDPEKLFAEYLKAKRLDPRKIQLSDEEKAKRAQQAPPPPLPVMVEQLKGQNAMQLQAAKTQASLQQVAAEAQHEQQLLQQGGTTPHMASASAQVEKERIRAESMQIVEASRAHAEQARADKELQIATQNGQFKIHELELQRELALLKYANDQKVSIDTVKAQLAKSAMDNQTKRQLAAAEIQLASNENDKDRAHDMHKHTTSLVRDEMSTPNTP